MAEIMFSVCEDDGSGVRLVMAESASHAAKRYAADVWADDEAPTGSALDVAVNRSEVTTHWRVTREVVNGVATEVVEHVP